MAPPKAAAVGIIARSNSEPREMLTVVGENAFHPMDSQMLVAKKRLIPEETNASTNVFGLACENVDGGLSQGNDESENYKEC